MDDGAAARDSGLPADPAVPALHAIAQHGLDATLRRLGLEPPFDEVSLLKHHVARRCTFAFRAAGRPLVAKAHCVDVSGQAELLTALERHGLAGGRPPTAPRLVACDAGLRLIVTERLDGERGTGLIRRGARVGELAAGWLARQWNAPIDIGPLYDSSAYLERLERNGAVVSEAAPELARAVGAVLEALARCPPAMRDPVLSHGSFGVGHIVDMGAGAGVVDWDGFAQSRPELDVATFLATLAREAGGNPDLELPAARAAGAFRAAVAPVVDHTALAWYEAGARLRNARHLCVGRPVAWAARAERLLAEARLLVGAGT